MTESQIPFLIELRNEVRQIAMNDLRVSPRRRAWRHAKGYVSRFPAGALAGALAVVVSAGVAVAVLQVHASPRVHAGRSTASLTSTLGPMAPGFAGASPDSAGTALSRAAQAAAAGTATPRLRAGEAWYSTARELISQQLFNGAEGDHAIPALRQSVVEEEKWFPTGEERTLTFSLSPTIAFAGGGQGTPSSAPGFGDWDAMSPFTVTGPKSKVLRALNNGWAGFLGYAHGNHELSDRNHSAFTVLARAAALLGADPVSPASRAAIFRAISALPDLGYLKDVRDPLGRRGVAVTETTSDIKAFANVGPQGYELQVIFNPTTGTVLGQRTIAARVIPTLHVRKGAVLFSWAYRLTRLVAASTIARSSYMIQRVREIATNVIRKSRPQQRRLAAPGQPCHRFASSNGRSIRLTTSTGKCGQLLEALYRRNQTKLATNAEMVQTLRALLTPPPAIPPG